MAHRNPGRLAVEVIAAVFVVAGVLGLGKGVGAPLTADGAVHLALGLAGLTAARTTRGARSFLIAGGVVYFLWHYGGAVVLTDGAVPDEDLYPPGPLRDAVTYGRQDPQKP